MRISDWSSDVCSSDLLAAIDQNDVVALAEEPMEALRAETGETAYLTVWGNRGPCIVRRLEGSRETPLSIRVGYVLPLTTSATGRTFLAHLPPVLTRRLREEERERLPLARGIAQIGRASCRERVCQYVEISVVAGSLTKKINKHIQ